MKYKQNRSKFWVLGLIVIHFSIMGLSAKSIAEIAGKWRGSTGDYEGFLSIQKNGKVEFHYISEDRSGKLTGMVTWEEDNGSYFFDLIDTNTNYVWMSGCSLETIKGNNTKTILDCPMQGFERAQD